MYPIPQGKKLDECVEGRLGKKSVSLLSLSKLNGDDAKAAPIEQIQNGQAQSRKIGENVVKTRKSGKRKSRDSARLPSDVASAKSVRSTPLRKGKKAKNSKENSAADDSAFAEGFEPGEVACLDPAARLHSASVSSGVSSMTDPVHALSSSSRKKLRGRRQRGSEMSTEATAAEHKRTSSPCGQPGLLMYDSEEEARTHLRWLLRPLSVDTFFSEYFEEKPVFIARSLPGYYGELFSTSMLDDTLRNTTLQFGEDINLARYVDGVRQTLNPCGPALAPLVWRFFEQEGCSVQLTSPQTVVPSIGLLCARLQELFCCFVGANTYLTPAGTQGFAPHWDDIDAFVLQLEGTKHWRVYKPRGDDEALPRQSSGNFNEEDVADMEIAFEGKIEPGDLLYIPRGFIHQGFTDANAHSLHVTVSVNRRNTFADMFEKLVPEVLSDCIDSCKDFRRSLPPRYLSFMGVSNQPDFESPSVDGADECDCGGTAPISNLTACRAAFLQRYRHLTDVMREKMLQLADSAADMMAGDFLKQALPPALNHGERLSTIHGSDAKWSAKKGRPINFVRLDENSGVKLIRKHSQRVIFESEDRASIEHRAHNSLVFEQRQSVPVPLEPQMICTFEDLARNYPAYTTIGSLEGDSLAIKIELCERLWNAGLLMLE